ncbi:MAG: hypothetical protein AAF478_07715 [Pseudomonadota bacterium]
MRLSLTGSAQVGATEIGTMPGRLGPGRGIRILVYSKGHAWMSGRHWVSIDQLADCGDYCRPALPG